MFDRFTDEELERLGSDLINSVNDFADRYDLTHTEVTQLLCIASALGEYENIRSTDDPKDRFKILNMRLNSATRKACDWVKETQCDRLTLN